MLTETQTTDNLAQFVALEKRRRQLEDELDAVKHEAARLQELILEEWADRGQQNATVDGLVVYVATDFYCNKRSDFDQAAVCERLEAAGYGALVSPGYNATKLKAVIKEHVDEGREVPESLRECLNFDSIPRLRTRQR